MNTPDKNSVFAGMCTLMPLLVTTSLDASIYTNTSFGLSSITIGAGDTSVVWDVDGDSVAEFTLKTNAANLAISLDPDAAKSAMVFWRSTWYGNSVHVIKFGAGALIPHSLMAPPDSFFLNKTIHALLSNLLSKGDLNAGFTSGSPGYIGFSFLNGGKTCYGWASITVTEGSAGTLGSMTINSWAYDNSGDYIQAGAVPEPSETAMGLGALALGAAGLRRWRRQKAA
jgi:MYXO-CTERM domain-containing protein